MIDRAIEQDDEIDLWAVLATLREYKRWLVMGAAICGVIAVALALTADPVYRAAAVVTEVESNSNGTASLLSSQLGGLANLAGISASLRGASRQAMAILESRYLAEEFIKRYGLVELMSSDDEAPVTLWQAVERFRLSMLAIQTDTNLGRTTVVMDWTDPVVAAEWANAYVGLANEIIRARAIEEATRNIEYLEEQIAQTNVVDVQRVMYNLVQNETQTLMLAHARPDYAFRLVDPAVPPETRISPRRTLMVLFGITLGLLGGAVVALVHAQIRRRRNALAVQPAAL